jgi:hypothetical protein
VTLQNHHTLHGVMEEYYVDDDLEQRKAPHTRVVTRKNFSSVLRREPKRVRIEILYVKRG